MRKYDVALEMLRSWEHTEGTANSLEDILAWIDDRYQNLSVDIQKTDFSYDGFWYYDKTDGQIRNRKNSFFQLSGYRSGSGAFAVEQPVIIQDEIGYLGIICRNIGGVLNFLMQAKIEPGNINKIQISPTIQATRSNFMQLHGGRAPAYLEYFRNAGEHTVLVDQIQSEQSSRFYKKRNRNIIILVDEDVDVRDSHMWMTLGQLKCLLKRDNLVNMDTRTVLSCIPLSPEGQRKETGKEAEGMFADKPLAASIFCPSSTEKMRTVFSHINDIRMYREQGPRLVPLDSLKEWTMRRDGIFCSHPYDFHVVYCRIGIEGREVTQWEQPLVEADGMAVFGLFSCVHDGKREFLVRVREEIGCFDSAELGPTIQLEPTNPRNRLDDVEKLFLQKLDRGKRVMADVRLSEEGGRFYHEQNRNAIIEIERGELDGLPDGYFWMDYSTLNHMVQYNNWLNIQLRNLLVLLDM